MEKTRLISNVLLIILLAGNLYFSVQYVQNLKESQAPAVDKGVQEVLQIKNANFL
jgi:hypothetical protein